MRQLIYILTLALLIAACNSDSDQDGAKAVELPVTVYNFDGLKPMLDIEDDTLRIFNFWATWCVPCVKELPYFEKINTEYTEQKVKVILVSLDFVEDIETALIPFIKKNKLGSEVLLLDDPDANRWIPMVDPSWDGAIPVTLFKLGAQRNFVPHTMDYQALVNTVNNFLNTDK